MGLSFSYSALKEFEQCPLKYQKKRITKEFVEEQTSWATYGEQIHKAFEDYVREGKPLPNDVAYFSTLLDKFKPYKVECELEVVLTEELTPTTWFAKDAWLRGKIDLMVWMSPTKVLVYDYKTGARRPDFDQLEMFALFVFQLYPEVETVSSGFIWTKDKALDTQTFTRAECNALWAKHLGRIRKVYQAHESDIWPAKPSGLCKYCGWKPNCAYGRR